MSDVERLFNAFSHQLMETPVVILFSSVVVGLAIIYMIFFEGQANVHELRKARKMLVEVVRDKSCAPILLRLAWHDAGTYDKERESLGWPNAGGAIGSIRTLHELEAPANKGLMSAISKYLSPIKAACPLVSWADLVQLAGAVAVEESGGPKLSSIMRFGRMDGIPESKAEPNFGLPDALPPFGGPKKGRFDAKDPASHLRWVFGKYGMDDRDIVSLSGAHTLGRAFNERSGTVKEGYSQGTQYTRKGCPFAGNSTSTGGKSWTKNWLVFDNSYFTEIAAPKNTDLVAFPTDLALRTDPKFKPLFEEFAKDQDSFFRSYADSHVRLSELGAQFSPSRGICIDKVFNFYF